MNFLYPLFLIAGISVLIPLIIHLFNFRKFKKVYFPNIQFLEQLKIATKKQSILQQYALLASRIFLLLTAILAFAQPYFEQNNRGNLKDIHVVFIDNSMSMNYAQAQKTNFSKAKEAAQQFLNSNAALNEIVLLNNDYFQFSNVLSNEAAKTAINDLSLSAHAFSMDKLMQNLQAESKENNGNQYHIHVFSDLPEDAFVHKYKIPEHLHAKFYLINVAQKEYFENILLDTVYFAQPYIDPQQANKLIVKTRNISNEKKDKNNDVHVQILLGDKVAAFSKIIFDEKAIAIDTFDIQIKSGQWQALSVVVNDANYTLDDTFNIALKTNPTQTCLVITNENVNQYLQAAFNTFTNFQYNVKTPEQAALEPLEKYSLCIIQHQNSLPQKLSTSLLQYIKNGHNVFWIPKVVTAQQVQDLNNTIASFSNIKIQGLDTSKQQVNYINQYHRVLNDVFANIPENVALPTTTSRIVVQSGLNANEEIIMRYKDGKPLLANYQIGQGQLFFLYSPLDISNNNFVNANFFAPTIYKLATMGSASFHYQQYIGSEMPIWLPENNKEGRAQWKLYKDGKTYTPLLKPYGNGTQLFTQNAINEPGFYHAVAVGQTDSFLIGFNTSKFESNFVRVDENTLKTYFGNIEFHLKTNSDAPLNINATGKQTDYWKFFIIAALIALTIETYLLYKKKPSLS